MDRLRKVAMLVNVARKCNLGDANLFWGMDIWAQMLLEQFPMLECFTLIFPTDDRRDNGPGNLKAMEGIVKALIDTEKKANPNFRCPKIQYRSCSTFQKTLERGN